MTQVFSSPSSHHHLDLQWISILVSAAFLSSLLLITVQKSLSFCRLESFYPQRLGESKEKRLLTSKLSFLSCFECGTACVCPKTTDLCSENAVWHRPSSLLAFYLNAVFFFFFLCCGGAVVPPCLLSQLKFNFPARFI